MKLSIIIPVYNEAPMAREVLQRVMAAPLPAGMSREVIVVDDGSDEATRTILGELHNELCVAVYRLTPNQGKGRALREGIAACTGDIVLFQDCDLEYDPQDYLKLVTPIAEGKADVVYGSRFLGNEPKPEISPLFLFGNRLLTALSNLFSGMQVTDMETGYKVFRRNIITTLRLAESRFGIEPEITAKIARQVRTGGVRITEVPIRYRARNYAQGKKIGFADGLRAIWCIAKYNHRGGAPS